ncbi:hypothetical protein I4U23_004596 [Adineta vaga]|nr:hypothetical protein I4U23_004596 [Adineta vaga]
MGGSSSLPVDYSGTYPDGYPRGYSGTHHGGYAIGYPRRHSRRYSGTRPGGHATGHPRNYSGNYSDGFRRRRPPPAVRDNFTGRQIAVNGRPYFFEKQLGKGGFGAVYQAKAPNGTAVAVKVMVLNNIPRPQMEGLVKSFLNEVEQLNRLRKESNHVVIIHDFGFDPRAGNAYIVMELGNENLTKLVARLREMTQTGGPSIDEEMIKEFWHQIVSIISTLQKNRIVHMDLKPDNLILFGATLKIGDLGIAKKEDALHDAQLGTYGYSAPEVMQDIGGARRFYNPKADIWSMGAILYYMVYGEHPNYDLGPRPPRGVRPYPDRDLLNMLHRTMVFDPRQRADIHEVMHHPFTRS